MTASSVESDLRALASPTRAKISQSFFKTGPGEYGEGDRFFGIKVPMQKIVAKKYKDLNLNQISLLLDNRYHECRLSALFILRFQFEKGDESKRAEIYKFYLKNTKFINNWDLVDSSAPYIVGAYLQDKPKDILYKLVESKNLWEQRISIVATSAFIRKNDFDDTIKLSKVLLAHRHDLIHKAVGWMLREVGKRNEKVLTDFLDSYVNTMPRTMLRYSIERLDPKKRRHYLNA